MIDRVILLKFDESTSNEQHVQVVEKFMALQKHLRGVHNMQGGLNTSARNQGYQVVLTVRFENQAAIDAYEVNPEHHACSAFIREVGRKDGIVVDYVV
jgi:hypothetical protein